MRTAALFFSPPSSPPRAEEVFTAGFHLDGARPVPGEWGPAVRAVLDATEATLLVVDPPPHGLEVEALTEPVRADRLDVVLGRRRQVSALDQPINALARLCLGAPASDAASAARAFRVEALRAALPAGVTSDAEGLVALAGQLYRFGEVPVTETRASTATERARTLARWSRILAAPPASDSDGHLTLKALEAAAPNYNAWLAQTFGAWAGRRILEVGAGIGTITAQLAEKAEHVTALELEPLYVERLRNRFRGRPNVEPLQSDVNLADWAALARRGFDTIVLSNVLEHIEDDGAAIQTFARILPPGGRLLVYVPALPALFGSLDEGVGHHRRYLPATLREVLEGGGFSLEHLRWMNLVGIPAWLVNGRLFRRTSLPPLQLRLYDAVAPLLARLEARVPLPVGMNLFAVAARR